MARQPIYPGVFFDRRSNNHLLRTGNGLVVVNPLKKPRELRMLRDTGVHPDIKQCRTGQLILVNNGRAVGKVIPVPPSLEKEYLKGPGKRAR